MNEEFDDLKSKLRIQINKLHLNAEEQPDLMFRVGELAAGLKAETKQARIRLDQTKAEIQRAARNTPEDFGIAKVTEAVIQAAIDMDKSVLAAKQKCVNTEEESDRASALLDAYHHRKAMIQTEAQLYMANYWGSPDVQGQAMEEAKNTETDRIEKHVERKRRRRRDKDVETETQD